MIKVGGASDVEVSEAKDRVQDALCATQAAVDEGIVAGGGVALLNASKVLNEMIAVEENPDIKFGLKIVLGACRVPITTIASNAGEQGAVIVEKILQQVRGPSSFSPPPASAAVHAARWACRGCFAG